MTATLRSVYVPQSLSNIFLQASFWVNLSLQGDSSTADFCLIKSKTNAKAYPQKDIGKALTKAPHRLRPERKGDSVKSFLNSAMSLLLPRIFLCILLHMPSKSA
jgi:hypothetical protein